MKSATKERLAPLLFAIVTLVIVAVIFWFVGMPSVPKSLLAGTMTFGVVVAGFAATQRNMLLGMRGSRMLRIAVRSGYHNNVLAYLEHSVYAGILTSAVSFTGIFIKCDTLLWDACLAVLTFAIALVLATVLRNELMMALIVKRFVEDQDSRNG